MGRAQNAKGRAAQLKVGRNRACLRNAIMLDPAVLVATLPYIQKAATPRAPDKSGEPTPLTPRTSVRMQAKVLDSLVGGKPPRGGFMTALAKEFNVFRKLPARILQRMRTRATGTADARSGNDGRPPVYGGAYKKFIVDLVDKARNHKPRPFVAGARMIQVTTTSRSSRRSRYANRGVRFRESGSRRLPHSRALQQCIAAT